MRLVTVATHSEGYFPFLVKSCERMGARLDVLGWGQPWGGFSHKTELVFEHVSALDEDEVVCVLDAYDTLLLRPLDEMEAAFRHFSEYSGARVVVGCDRADMWIARQYAIATFGTCNEKSINAGTYVGRARDVAGMLHGMLARDLRTDDQKQMTKFCREHPSIVHVDCDMVFFWVAIASFGRDAIDARVRVENGGTVTRDGVRPFVVHAPSRTSMIGLLRALGYDVSSEFEATQRREFATYLRQSAHHHIREHRVVVIAATTLLTACVLWTALARYRRLR